MSRTSKPARSRLRPPGPRAERRRLWVISARALIWSMNWDSCELPKNSLRAAMTGLELMRSWGMAAARSAVMVIFSLIVRSIRVRPMRKAFSTSSPTDRTRRLPRWSMSSTVPSPKRRLSRYLRTST